MYKKERKSKNKKKCDFFSNIPIYLKFIKSIFVLTCNILHLIIHFHILLTITGYEKFSVNLLSNTNQLMRFKYKDKSNDAKKRNYINPPKTN